MQHVTGHGRLLLLPSSDCHCRHCPSFALSTATAHRSAWGAGASLPSAARPAQGPTHTWNSHFSSDATHLIADAGCSLDVPPTVPNSTLPCLRADTVGPRRRPLQICAAKKVMHGTSIVRRAAWARHSYARCTMRRKDSCARAPRLPCRAPRAAANRSSRSRVQYRRRAAQRYHGGGPRSSCTTCCSSRASRASSAGQSCPERLADAAT